MSDALTDDHEGQLNGLDEILDPAHTALVVVDMQNDFCAENGYIHNAQGALAASLQGEGLKTRTRQRCRSDAPEGVASAGHIVVAAAIIQIGFF